MTKLTADEVEYGGRAIAGKAWSEEARAAALAARQRNKKPGGHAGLSRESTNALMAAGRAGMFSSQKPGDKKPGVGQSTASDAHILSSHDSARNLHLQIDQMAGARSRETTHASMLSSRAFAASVSNTGAHGGINISEAAHNAHVAAGRANSMAANSAKPGSILQRAHNSLATHHTAIAIAMGNELKKPKSKSFYVCGDAVELKTAPGKRLLVIDAGIDEKAGPWVAVRETRAGVAGADQKRFVVKPEQVVGV